MKASHFLATLFAKHQLDLQRLIASKFGKMHHEAEDIVQDAFHNILRAENVEQLENPKAYLYQTASNLALNRIRKHRRHHQYLHDLGVSEEDELDELSPERSVLARHDLQRLEQALVKLPEKYRQTFLLSRVHDKSYREISEQLQIAESTVEKHIIKALKYLRDQLDEEVRS
jgi:RNA polymerase sigma factor (sigma-70 family)